MREEYEGGVKGSTQARKNVEGGEAHKGEQSTEGAGEKDMGEREQHRSQVGGGVRGSQQEITCTHEVLNEKEKSSA